MASLLVVVLPDLLFPPLLEFNMDLKIDINGTGDLIFDNGNIPLTTEEADVVGQRVAIRLRTIMGEWFLDENYGTPWLQVIGTKKTASQIDPIIQREVLSVEGVREIVSWSSGVRMDRTYWCSFTIRTKNGGLSEAISLFPPTNVT